MRANNEYTEDADNGLDVSLPELGACYRDLLAMLYDPTIKLIILQGGTSAGKTFNVQGALLTLMDLGVYPKLNPETNQYEYKPKNFKAVAVGVTLGALESGAEEDFGIWADAYKPDVLSKDNNNKSKHRYRVNKSTYRFAAVPDIKRAKAIGKHDIVFMNEANEQSKEVFSALYIRTRLKMILDYNPDTENWIHALIDADDTAFRIWTYKDNINNLSPNIIAKLQHWKETDPDRYHVYGKGYTGKIEGLVFKNVEYVDEMPAFVPRERRTKEDAQAWTYGVDWGEKKDPTAIVRCCFYKGKIYAEELYYLPTASNQEVVDAFKSAGLVYDKNNPLISECDFYCDIRPSYISLLRDLGYFALQAKKGANSITAGIALIRGFGLCITKRSHNFKKEAENYQYKKNRNTGVTMESDFAEGYDHLFDALRYAVSGNHLFRDLFVKMQT